MKWKWKMNRENDVQLASQQKYGQQTVVGCGHCIAPTDLSGKSDDCRRMENERKRGSWKVVKKNTF